MTVAVGTPLPSAPLRRRRIYGIVLALAFALLAIGVSTISSIKDLGLGALTLAIMFGIVAGNTFFPRIATQAGPGVDFSKSTLLRAGVILYGFQISFQQIAEVGWAGVIIAALMVCLTFTLAVQLGTRLFKLDRETSMLIGAGSAICGAAAVMACEPVVRGQAHKVSVAIATVVVFGTLSMFLYPLLYPILGLSEHGFGIFAGSTIHEVAQVVAVGNAIGDSAASTAVIEKMLRVMMLAPFLLVLSTFKRPHEGDASTSACSATDSSTEDASTRNTAARGDSSALRGKPAKTRLCIPWFAVCFIAASAINSLQILPVGLVNVLLKLDLVLLAMAMAALGMRTHLGAVRQAGAQPLLLAASLFGFLVVGGWLINVGVMHVFGLAG